MPVTTFSANSTARAAEVNANFSLCLLTDTARTVTARHVLTGGLTFGNGSDTSDVTMLLENSSTGVTRQFLRVSRNTASSNVGIMVRNDDATASSSQAFATVYAWAQDGAADYYKGSFHTYGANYNVAAFRGYTIFSSDGGLGTMVRSIHATTANIMFLVGATGGVADEVLRMTPVGIFVGASTAATGAAAGEVILANAKYYRGASSGGVARALIGIDASNVIQVASEGQNVQIGTGTVSVGGSVATNATAGFLCVPSCAGIPTGVPSGHVASTIPVVADRTNNKLYIYSGGAWQALN